MQRHQSVRTLSEEDRLTEDQVGSQDRRENAGECEEILVSIQQFDLTMNCLRGLC